MPSRADKPKRRWFQFRLKTLLVIIAVLCVPLAWVGVRMNQKRHERVVIAEIERLGGEVCYEWQGKRWGGAWRHDMKPDSDEPPGLTSLRWLLGGDFFSDVVYVAFSRLRQRIPVDYQGAWRNHRSRKNAAPFLKDDDLRLVSTLPKLEELNLSNTDIGDFGLAHLQGLTHLRSLDLVCTNITDDGLRHLKSLKALKHLNLDGTKTTEAAIGDLAKALPGCEISGP